MKRFIGIWQNEGGNKLEIKQKSEKIAIVTFISGKTGEPIERLYAEKKLSIDLDAALDFHETSLEIELWEKGKGFKMCLLDNDYLPKAKELGVTLSRNFDKKHEFLEDFYHLFEPLSSYKRIKEK